MSRIRSVHPGLFTDEAFLELTVEAPLAVTLLLSVWCESDDQGIFEWKPLRFKMRALPATSVDAGPLLDVLERVGFVKRFEVDGKVFGACRNFCKWQRPKTPQILYPCPPEISEIVGLSERDERDKPERGTALGRILCERQNGLCHYCETEITFYRKKPNSLEIDHKTPVSRGGIDEVENLAATCRKCNSLKANMTEDEFRGRFAISELRERHSSQSAKDVSRDAKTSSRSPILPNAEIAPQMEEVGDKKKEPPNPPAIVQPPRPPTNGHAANGALPPGSPSSESDIEKEARSFNFAFFTLREIEFGGPPVPASYPAKDLSVAKGWIERGVEFYPFRELLEQQMRRMAKANKPPPSSLWFFNRSVDEAIASDWQGYRE